MRFRSTGLGNTELRGDLQAVHLSDKGILEPDFQTTEPVQWHLGAALEPSDIPKLVKVIFKPSLVLKTILSVFRIKKNPKEPENLMAVEWEELKPAKKAFKKINPNHSTFNGLREDSMIIRIIFFSTTPDELAKGKKIWDEEMAPLFKKQKGFYKAFRAKAQDEPGGGVMVQLWETKKDEEVWRINPDYEKIARRVEPLIPELRIERDFEVEKEI